MKLRGKCVAVLLMAVLAAALSASFAAAEENAADAPAITVGKSTLTADEVVGVLRESAGGNPMMVGLMLSQSTLAERVELASQMADAVLFAEAARGAGIDKRPEVALKIKWQTAQLLLEEYFKEISKSWDMSPEAANAYYEEHKGEFVQAPAFHIRHILTSSEKEARDAVLDIYKNKDFAKAAEKFSRDQNSAPNGGDLGWVEKGTMPAALEEAVEAAQLNVLAGPVESEIGWQIFEVLEKRPERQLTAEEAKDEISQRMQMAYLSQELESLRTKIKVEINEKALENLGGIPAAETQSTPEAPAEEELKPVEEKVK